MASRQYILPLVLLLSACGGAGNDDGRPAPGAHREEVMADLGIDPNQPVDPVAVAALAREFVYLTNHLPPDGISTPIKLKSDFYPHYVEWKSGNEQYICGGMAYVLAWMLEEIGIPARDVLLATEEYFSGDMYATHVTTEVFLNGRWVIHDPTFNADFHCAESDSLGVVDLRACDPISVRGSVGAQISGRTLYEWPVSYASYLYAYQVNKYYRSLLSSEDVASVPPKSDWPKY